MLDLFLFCLIFVFFSWGIYGKSKNKVESVNYNVLSGNSVGFSVVEEVKSIKYFLDDEDMIKIYKKKLSKLGIRELYKLSSGKVKNYKKFKKVELINKLSSFWEDLDI
ncbi:hypothetical protein IQE94_11670 [Synechocystis sp. PCC 7339]|uniref:hypothetical protein n=1 Tax=Synechocystis sp. PCC 7339 TaxID=2782213 RepID=UPI001CC168E3|nr:hypothetical protein [Synechocystis sp. PCC 7339]UAJ71791.1 hypothetical protein IQE94_11670 [Synechocystis sp. PCC 7339]